MKTILSFIVLSCVVATTSANLKIVTTTEDLASIASAVGGKFVSASSIVTGARDAHRIEAKPSYMSRASSANVFIAVGLDLEVGYEKAILDGSGNSNIAIGSPGHINASDFCYVLEKPSGGVTRAMGDIHPYGNPHVMLDPYNGRMVAAGLAKRFGSLDKAHATDYEANADAFIGRLDSAMFGPALVTKYGGDKLWQWHNAGGFAAKLNSLGVRSQLSGWAAKMLAFDGVKIFSYHRSLTYLARRFGLNVIDELEPKPGLEPTPGHLAEVIREGEAQKVRAVVIETFRSAKSAQLVASRIGAKVIVIPQGVGHSSGAKDYITLFDEIVNKLSAI